MGQTGKTWAEDPKCPYFPPPRPPHCEQPPRQQPG